MKIHVTEQQGITIVAPEGRFLGALHAPTFHEQIEKLKDDGVKQIIIDLSLTDMMDSTAIGALIRALTTMRRVEGDIRLANLEKRIRSVFMMTKLLGPVFESYESLDEAVASYEDHAHPANS